MNNKLDSEIDAKSLWWLFRSSMQCVDDGLCTGRSIGRRCWSQFKQRLERSGMRKQSNSPVHDIIYFGRKKSLYSPFPSIFGTSYKITILILRLRTSFVSLDLETRNWSDFRKRGGQGFEVKCWNDESRSARTTANAAIASFVSYATAPELSGSPSTLGL